jgi:hypothetical protein
MSDEPIPQPSTALERPESRVPVAVGLAPTTIDEAWRLSQNMARSGLVPASFRDKPQDVMIAVMMGAELGLAPVQALNSIAVINGRPTLYGDGLLAVVKQSPLCQLHDEFYLVGGQRVDQIMPDVLAFDDTAASCAFRRRGSEALIVRVFSVADAKKAHLWGKSGPWQEYPSRMLMMRARGFAARDAFPDVLRGFTTTEEANDIPPAIVEVPVTVPRVRRKSETLEAPAPVDEA